MNKYLILTSISEPSVATLKYCEIADQKDWKLVFIGDLKTPHASYQALETKYKNFMYMTPEQQEELYPELSEAIGWNKCQRRNIGFVYAYDNGCDILATSDDDNIPYDNWGDEMFVGQEIEVDCYENKIVNAFDPISVTEHKSLWHRGYPIEALQRKNDVEYKGKKKITPLIQADFWDGDPDIDAICRITQKPIVKFQDFKPFCSTQLSPFNSQNTFLAREVIPYYVVFPYLGRMDDIWGAYVLQYYFPNSVIYNKATVYQDRNIHNLVNNMMDEVIGYRNTLNFIVEPYTNNTCIPQETQKFLDIYFRLLKICFKCAVKILVSVYNQRLAGRLGDNKQRRKYVKMCYACVYFISNV